MKVIVLNYNPQWVQEFEMESEKLNLQIGTVLNNVYHIGSTAVPGLMAKPIIDIMLAVSDLSELDRQSFKLENMGYEALGENGIAGRRYFRKGGENRTHQIHAFQSGDANLMRHLAFRDYLIAHKKIADEYGALKFEIAQSCQNDIEKYCDEKDAFIKHQEALAMNWQQERRSSDEVDFKKGNS